MLYGHTDLKKGVAIDLDGVPHQVIESSHMATGRGGAVMRTKLKNLRTGAVIDRSFRTSDKIPAAELTRENMQYLYSDGSSYYFMNPKSYEQITLGEDLVGDNAPYLVEGAKAIIMYFDGSPLAVDVGNNVPLKVVQTETGAKGDTATAALKPAKLETGLEIMVPLFINEGDIIKVDTRTGSYLERLK
jgi:elongation factor P